MATIEEYTIKQHAAHIILAVLMAGLCFVWWTGAATIAHNLTHAAPHMSLCNAAHTDCYDYCIVASSNDDTMPRDASMAAYCVNGCTITLDYAASHGVPLHYAWRADYEPATPNYAVYNGAQCIAYGVVRMPDGDTLNTR